MNAPLVQQFAERFIMALPGEIADDHWETVSAYVRLTTDAYGAELLEGPAERLYPIPPQFFVRDLVLEVYPVTRWAMVTTAVATAAADPPTVNHR